MFKKFIFGVCILSIALFTFGSCGNENIGFGNFNFTKAHISVGD